MGVVLARISLSRKLCDKSWLPYSPLLPPYLFHCPYPRRQYLCLQHSPHVFPSPTTFHTPLLPPCFNIPFPRFFPLSSSLIYLMTVEYITPLSDFNIPYRCHIMCLLRRPNILSTSRAPSALFHIFLLTQSMHFAQPTKPSQLRNVFKCAPHTMNQAASWSPCAPKTAPSGPPLPRVTQSFLRIPPPPRLSSSPTPVEEG